MSGPWLAAITLKEEGGGVAAVTRLLWQVLVDRWPGQSRVVTLIDPHDSRRSLESSTADRLRFGSRLAAGQATGRCDWVLYSHLSLARVQRFLPPLGRRPYIVFLHGIEAWCELRPSQLALLRGASLRIANSAYTARRVAARHASIGEVRACPLSLEPGHPASPTVSSRPRSTEPLVLIVARMQSTERYKGHDQLIDAWPAVCAKVPRARLVIAGGGDDADRLRRKAVAAGLGDAVEFTGFIPRHELEALYDRAAVFAMPSRGEGFGLVYAEAMAHGMPCIGSFSDAASEVIVDGETGFLIEQSDLGALADRIVRLLSDDELRETMGHAARRAATSRFAYDRFATDFLAMIDSTTPRLSPGLARGAPA